MTNNLIYILILLLCFSCTCNSKKTIQNTTNNEISTPTGKKIKIPNKDSVPTNLESKQNSDLYGKETNQNTRIKAKVISIEERLIMPSDYLTTAMTVKTIENKTLVFLDMSGFEKLIDKEITIEYNLVPSSKLLLCFDCSSYSEEIDLYDITSFHSEIEFKELQLMKYVEDNWITPASTFEMIDKNGKTELFNSNDNDMILDSIKMKSFFFKYGIITKIHPELENRAELEQMIE